jgi:hypothetical protein
MTMLLHHITLQSGHVRASPRSEVRESTIDALAPILRDATEGHAPALPWVEPRCWLTGAAAGDCAIVTVWSEDEGEDVPIATIGIAAGRREAERLWAMLHATYVGMGDELATPDDQAPPLPWCAARLEVGIALRPDALEWIADAERSIAWTWIERGRPRPGLLRPPPRPPASVRRAPRRRR